MVATATVASDIENVVTSSTTISDLLGSRDMTLSARIIRLASFGSREGPARCSLHRRARLFSGNSELSPAFLKGSLRRTSARCGCAAARN